MSLKNKPRAMPIEEIVTRFKSSQLKRKLPAKPSNPPQRKGDKLAKSLNKLRVKPQVAGNIEFYPSKLKRKATVKKIVLVPKHDYKVVATRGNKRKLNAPKKETICNLYNSPSSVSSGSPKHIPQERSISEMINLIEDSGNFDDDDLMEILTCPSPVWWEDDPPDGYTEDPITQLISGSDKNTKVAEDESRKENYVQASHTADIVKTERLENHSLSEAVDNKPLLDINIKINDPKFIKKRGKLESLLGNLKKVKTKNEKDKQINCIEPDVGNTNSTSINGSHLINSSLDEDTILTTLENMEIPIDNTGILNTCKSNNESIKIENTSFDSPINFDNKLNSEVSKNKDLNLSNKIEYFDDSTKVLDKSSMINNLNSIKDLKVSAKQSSINALKYLESDTSDFVTVYKIINKEATDKKDNENDKNGQINSYFKNCKYLRRQSKMSVEGESNTDQKCIASEKETVKYCLKCSSIFKTEDCKYCMKKIKSSV